VQGSLQAGFSTGYLFGQLVARNSLRALKYVNPFHYILPKEIRRSIRKPFVRNSTPFNSKGGITGLFKGLKDIQGRQVIVTGRENLERIPLNGIPGKKIANLFLPAHRHDISDAILMSSLDLPHFLLFANLLHLLPIIGLVPCWPPFLSLFRLENGKGFLRFLHWTKW
jgi:hypothetical protein